MSTVTPDEQTSADSHDHDGHGHHEHPSYVAHHFDTSQQQFDAGKLGIWLFLAQEILFFSGLFVFYVYIKTLKPGAFEYAHSFLEVKYGLINTFVLITSSLTMAWGVRCAQLNQKNGLKLCLALTLLGAFGFLGVKYVEYTNKFSHGLYWGSMYTHHLGGAHGDVHGASGDHGASSDHGDDSTHGAAADHAEGDHHADGEHGGAPVDVGDGEVAEATTAIVDADGPAIGGSVNLPDGAPRGGGPGGTLGQDGELLIDAEQPKDADAETLDRVAEAAMEKSHAEGLDGDHAEPFKPPISDPEYAAYLDELAVLYDNPKDAGLYFSVYYCMTGLHAIHVIAGIVVILWIFLRALKEEFHSDFFGPVDYVGLYWHLVDLVWIFLFPMLYLVR